MDTMAESYSPPEATNANMNFDRGARYIPKQPLDADFNFALGVYRVLAGFSNIFTAIWADSDASQDSGKMYALSWGPGTALSILNLDVKNLHDYYTQNYGGRQEETLTNIDTRDLNVSSI
jgi:hypothetical protein